MAQFGRRAADGNALGQREAQASLSGRRALPVGSVVGGFEIESLLGAGGFGVTYRARAADGVMVALKEFFPNAYAFRDANYTVVAGEGGEADAFRWGLDRFYDEALKLARLNHPNIVSVHRVFPANGTAYMALGLVTGEPLADRLARIDRLTSVDLDALSTGLLDALDRIHAEGLLHRDVKPGNIIWTDPAPGSRASGRPVLIDFGSARSYQQGQPETMTALVSAGYSPPEQYLRSGRHGPWTDIYAAAATLWHAAIGDPPPESNARAMALEENDPDPLPPLPGRLDPKLARLIGAGLMLRASQRPQSVAAWRQIAETGEAPPPPETRTVLTPPAPAPPTPPAKPAKSVKPAKPARAERPEATGHGRRSALPVALLALLLVLLIGGGGAALLLLPRDRPSAVPTLPPAPATPGPTQARVPPPPPPLTPPSRAETERQIRAAATCGEQPGLAGEAPRADSPDAQVTAELRRLWGLTPGLPALTVDEQGPALCAVFDALGAPTPGAVTLQLEVDRLVAERNYPIRIGAEWRPLILSLFIVEGGHIAGTTATRRSELGTLYAEHPGERFGLFAITTTEPLAGQGTSFPNAQALADELRRARERARAVGVPFEATWLVRPVVAAGTPE